MAQLPQSASQIKKGVLHMQGDSKGSQPMPQDTQAQQDPSQNPDQDSQQDQQQDPSQLVQMISDGLQQLAAMVQQAGMKEEIQMIGQISQAFDQFVQGLQQDQGQQPADQGQVPMETGGKPSQPAL